MKSTFFHIGVNRTMAAREHIESPQLKPDGRLPYIPLPDHHDPDFVRMTYGDPWGRLNKLVSGDLVWFIESGTIERNDWGYFVIAYFAVQAVYKKRSGRFMSCVVPENWARILPNAHEKRGDTEYSIVLGSPVGSRLLFANPLRLSYGEKVYIEFREALGLLRNPTQGYWFKRWFDDTATTKFFELLKERCELK